MRDIKFRAWHNGGNYPEEATMLHDKAHHIFKWLDEGQSVSIMQFTGLKDKNGVEIYEGDIVKAFTVRGMTYDYCFEKDNDPECIYQICFDDGCFQFKNTKQWSDGSNDWKSIENVELFKVEVIGNIYENPELLQETK